MNISTQKQEQLTSKQKWEQATLANNFIFYKVMKHHPDACKYLIEMLLHVKIEKMEMHNEDVIDIDHDSKGIRLNVYVKDTNKMYDVELQATDTQELPERARYYQDVMDLDSLNKGDLYKELRDSYVIFICLEDIFNNGLPIYTFEYICTEDINTRLNDRAIRHFFIAETCAKIIKDEEIRSFFEFLISNKATSSYTADLDKYVTDAKNNMRWRVQYMTWERQQAYARAEGIAIGEKNKALEVAENLLRMNILTVEQIAQAESLSVDEVLKLKKEIAVFDKK